MVDLARYRALVNPPKPRGAWTRTPEDAERIYGPQEFREWLHRQPCAVCGFQGLPEQMQQAHARTGGTGYKAHWTKTLPMCGPRLERYPVVKPAVEGCHTESGRGVKSFEKKHRVKLLELAARTHQRFLRECEE